MKHIYVEWLLFFLWLVVISCSEIRGIQVVFMLDTLYKILMMSEYQGTELMLKMVLFASRYKLYP